MEVKGEKVRDRLRWAHCSQGNGYYCKKNGEITTIIGPNGSGKSTLLKALTRLLRCSMGCVYLNQEDLYDIDSKKSCQMYWRFSRSAIARLLILKSEI